MPWLDLEQDVAELFDENVEARVDEATERHVRWCGYAIGVRACARCGITIPRSEHVRRRYCKGGCPGQAAPLPRACRRCGKPVPTGRRVYCDEMCNVLGRPVLFRPRWA